MNADASTFRLPDGYTIETLEHPGKEFILVLRKADGSAVAAFEFSALDPGPARRIWEFAWDDFEAYPHQDRHGY